jgi:hypothetical protein
VKDPNFLEMRKINANTKQKEARKKGKKKTNLQFRNAFLCVHSLKIPVFHILDPVNNRQSESHVETINELHVNWSQRWILIRGSRRWGF